VGSATCWPNSSSASASGSWTCRRRWRRGCGCWARDAPTRTIPTTRTRWQWRRCERRDSRRSPDHAGVLRLLAKRNNELGRARNKTACRLHALLAELVPGGIPNEINAASAQRMLDGVKPENPVEVARHALALEHLDDLRRNGQPAGVLYSGTVPRRLPGGEERPDWQAPRPPGRWQGHRTRARAHLPLSLSRTRKAGDPGTRSPALHFFPPESCHRRWFALGGVRKQESYIAWSLPLCRRAVGEWAQPLPGRSVTLADRFSPCQQVRGARAGPATLRAAASA
jgi:hypothetical protein